MLKPYLLILWIIFLFSCQEKGIKYNQTIIDEFQVNKDFLETIDDAEKALICGYLYAYGNECIDTSTSAKCKVLKELNITNECESKHLSFLSQWFENDVIMFYKFKNCPNLTHDSPIQNEINEMKLYRHNDTLIITVLVKGINNLEEKNWSSRQTEKFLIDNKTFKKIQ